MIHVERSRVTLPARLAEQMQREQARVDAHWAHRARGDKSSQQRSFDFRPIGELRTVLTALFGRKCAYCESPLEMSGDLENFRPRSTVRGAADEPPQEGYWWLAYAWENLLIACGRCNRVHKANRFPIEGPRATPGARGAALLAELPLLLDPCADEPSRFLRYDSSGVVSPNLPLEPRDLRRATTTIELLGLNRPDLVAVRAQSWRALDALMKHLLPDSPRAARVLPGILGPEQPYRAAASQWVAELALASRRRDWREAPLVELLTRYGADRAWVERVVERAAPTARKHATKQAAKRAAKRAARRATERVEAATPEAAPLSQPVFIRRITIRNFKAIRSLDLVLPLREAEPLRVEGATAAEPDAELPDPVARTGWYVLLGENSVGKSSVLEAVALALMGDARVQSLVAGKRIVPARLVHRAPGEAEGTSRRGCVIRLQLEPESLGEIELRITRAGCRFAKGGAPVATLVRGYGYVRLLPREGERHPDEESLVRFDNLFDPRAPLCDAERWMARLPYDETHTSPFDVAARTIRQLLPRSALASAAPADGQLDDAYLKPTSDGRVVIALAQRELSLDQLSAGYQSVIALAADIMAGIPATHMSDMRDVPGIVLLDEIGTQLHPRWRMHAIDDLRSAFPGMQFLATTHEPLCLKGVGRGEVAVLRRDAASDEVVAVTDGLLDPRALRVDQLLTSPMFGLDGTIDPEVDRLFQRYYALLARRDARTPEEDAERLRLERLLAPHRGLGYTRSDQLVYALLDEYLASDASRSARSAERVPDAVRRRVFEIWRNVRAHRAGGV